MSTKLTGVVTVHGSMRSRTAVVELHNAAGDVVDQVQVDDEGRYAYHLSPGTWTLRAWDSDGHRGAAEVGISDEREKTVDLDLEEPEGGH